MISVSIVSHGHGLMVVDLINQILESNYISRVILTLNIPEKLNLPIDHRITIVENFTPKGFGANHNFAFGLSKSNWFIVLNPDVILLDNFFHNFLNYSHKLSNSICAPLALNNQGCPDDNWRRFPTLYSLLLKFFGFDISVYNFMNHPGVMHRVDWVSGFFMIFPKDIYKKLNGFNEKYFLYYEDVDICYRAFCLNIPVIACRNLAVIHNAQRSSRKNLLFLFWHLKSLFRFLLTTSWKVPKELND